MADLDAWWDSIGREAAGENVDRADQHRRVITAERDQLRAEIANLRRLITGRHDWETIPVGEIRKAFRDGPGAS